MRVIIDGYNFIGQKSGLRGDLQALRRKLVDRLSAYRRNKGFPVSVVFDGGANDEGDRGTEHLGGVDVIFSRHGETADEVICRMAEKLRESCTVVSSDREVQKRVRQTGGIAIYCGEFESRLGASKIPADPGLGKDGIDDIDPLPRTTQKKGNPRRLPKAERRRQGRLKRL